LINHERLPKKTFVKTLFSSEFELGCFYAEPDLIQKFMPISPMRVTQSIEESGTLQGYDAMKEAMAMKIIEQTSSSRNISTDIPATDGGVTAPAVAKTGKSIFARVFDAITESQMKRTDREGKVFLGERLMQSQYRKIADEADGV
jgi:hypothetical protein